MRRVAENAWMEFFVSVAPVYQNRFARPSWVQYRDADSQPWDALGLFLVGYAFERQGRNPSFAHAANEVIRRYSKRPLREVTATECWHMFSELLKSKTSAKGLNAGNNPMAPKGTSIKDSGGRTKGKSAVELAQQLNNLKGMVAWALDKLAKNQTRVAHREICKVTGVKNKIASFFLRDLACEYRTFPNGKERYLLQPVDTWVRRCVTLANHRVKDLEGDEAIAKWIVEHSEQPELANQGMWYFGAQVAGSEFRLRSLSSREMAEHLMKDHVGSLLAGVEAWRR